MYKSYFGLKESPFSITPNPRYLYLSERHQEALAHLLYGIKESGGFVQLTGEVGTGKTMLTRALLDQLPEETDLALVLNPRVTVEEFLDTVCDELKIERESKELTVKNYVDLLSNYLLDAFAKGRKTVILIDEAQNLSFDVIEQVRLLTNIETTKEKLLQIILVGQPELKQLLEKNELRQVAQRITARYHLEPLSSFETEEYINHRMKVAGVTRPIFTRLSAKMVRKLSGGIPRLINIICDRALLGAYARGQGHVGWHTALKASAEVNGEKNALLKPLKTLLVLALVVILLAVFYVNYDIIKAVANNASQPTSIDGRHGNSQISPSPQVSIKTQNGEVYNINSNSDAKISEESSQRQSLQRQNSHIQNKQGIEVADSSDVSSKENASPKEKLINSKQTNNDEANEKGYDRKVISVSDVVYSLTEALAKREQQEKEAIGNIDSVEEVLSESKIDKSMISAFNVLLGLWDSKYSIIKGKTGCESALSYGLKCFYQKGNWAKLVRVDMPAMVELISHNGKKHYAVVIGFDNNETVTLKFLNETKRFKIIDFISYWSGDFRVIWKPPQLVNKVIKPGDKSIDIAWLVNALNAIDGKSSNYSEAKKYDKALEKRVKEFQKNRYLEVDGVVGEKTLIHIVASILDSGTPLLKKY